MMRSTTLLGVVAAAFIAVPALAQSGPARTQPAQDQMMAKGQLVKVDSDAQTLTIRDTDGKTADFKYTASTKVTGSQRGVAGLATMSGETVTVHFKAEGTDKIATEIDVQAAAKQNAPPIPAPPAPGR